MSEWLEYQPTRLTFRDGSSLNFFPEARMLYNEGDNVIWIENPAKGYRLERLRDWARGNKEVSRIDYQMLVNLPKYKETVRFYHPVGAGAGLHLSTNSDGDIFFFQKGERPLFSKNFTLASVTDGEIPSDRVVWQFHGYRHEH